MSPESPEGRIGRLEREMAALKQQVSDVVHDIETFAPVQMAVVRIETTVQQIEREILGLREAISADRRAAQKRGSELADEMKQMREEAAAQSRANKTQLITAAVSIITTLLIVTGTIVAAGLTG